MILKFYLTPEILTKLHLWELSVDVFSSRTVSEKSALVVGTC